MRKLVDRSFVLRAAELHKLTIAVPEPAALGFGNGAHLQPQGPEIGDRPRVERHPFPEPLEPGAHVSFNRHRLKAEA